MSYNDELAGRRLLCDRRTMLTEMAAGNFRVAKRIADELGWGDRSAVAKAMPKILAGIAATEAREQTESAAWAALTHQQRMEFRAQQQVELQRAQIDAIRSIRLSVTTRTTVRRRRWFFIF